MIFRSVIALLTLQFLTGPVWVQGQSSHHEEVEILEAPAIMDTTPAPDLAAVSRSIVEQTNAFRKKHERAAVVVNPKLAQTAQDFADYMAKTDRYGHTADDRHPAERAKAHGYEYCIILENIAYAYKSDGYSAETLAVQFASGWEESPGHRRNMLDADVSETGVAVARSSNTGYYFAVQMFGRPRSAAIEFKIENRADAAINYVIGENSYSLPPRYTRAHTVCRPPEVVFHWPGRKDNTETATPVAGAKLVVTHDANQWTVAKP